MRLKKEEFVFFLIVRCREDARVTGTGGKEVLASRSLAQCAFRLGR